MATPDGEYDAEGNWIAAKGSPFRSLTAQEVQDARDMAARVNPAPADEHNAPWEAHHPVAREVWLRRGVGPKGRCIVAELYLVANGPMPTTAAQAVVTTGTAIKTMLQVKLGTQSKGKVVEWGISFDGSAAATPGKVELLETGTVFGTVTASAAADITKLGDPNAVDPTTSAFIVGTSATGYTCTSEGSITAVRMFDVQLLPPTAPYVKQFPLGREPTINVSTALRVRVTFGAAINAYCYAVIEI